jgi:serine/threonine protein kinase
MGAVYRGVQTNLDRPVAIKILPPGVEKEDPSFAERFKSEARLMAKLNHPAVVAVYDFGTTSAGQLYFAMEYVDGSDVSQMIAAQGKLPPEHALAITAHVCDALQAAHELGIVHRDIKPANVLLNMKGQVKVADFGLAKIEDPGQHGLTKTGYAMGTPDFVAPEALTLGTAIDGRADLYAVGVMLYQMLTGKLPRWNYPGPSELDAGIDERLDEIVGKAMAADPEHRYQSAAAVRADLDLVLSHPLARVEAGESSGEVAAAVPVTTSVKGGKAGKERSKMPVVLGIAAAAALVVGLVVMATRGGEESRSGVTPLASAEKTSESPKTGGKSPSPRNEDSTPILPKAAPPVGTKEKSPEPPQAMIPPKPDPVPAKTAAVPEKAPEPVPTPVAAKPAVPTAESPPPAVPKSGGTPLLPSPPPANPLLAIPGLKTRLDGYLAARRSQLTELATKLRGRKSWL